MSLPVNIYDNPYFMYRLRTLDSMFDCLNKFDRFCDMMSAFNTEQEYFEYYNKVKEDMIQFIANTDAYKRFVLENYVRDECLYPDRNLYIEPNDGEYFISIDMKKANFNALRIYDETMFDNVKTWEEFVGKFTDNQHIIESKYIRQVVMGALKPERQMRYEKRLMLGFLKYYLINAMPEGLDIFSVGNDEIILFVKSDFKDVAFSLGDKVSEIVRRSSFQNVLRCETFLLTKLRGIDGYVRHPRIGIPTFKCVNSDYYNQVVKYISGDEISEYDLVFNHNGRPARFLEPIANPFPPKGENK